jgi:antitoxin MazE2
MGLGLCNRVMLSAEADCHTRYIERMTMLSFRVRDDEAEAVQRWAEALGVDRSEVLRDAVHRHLVALNCEHEVNAWAQAPLTVAEQSLSEIADWGPAEDWADWRDAAG